MKSRPIRELLIILRDNLERVMEDQSGIGMCYVNRDLRINGIITRSESVEIDKYLKNHIPSNYYKRADGYFFKPGAIPPRLKWLNKQINNLPVTE